MDASAVLLVILEELFYYQIGVRLALQCLYFEGLDHFRIKIYKQRLTPVRAVPAAGLVAFRSHPIDLTRGSRTGKPCLV